MYINVKTTEKLAQKINVFIRYLISKSKLEINISNKAIAIKPVKKSIIDKYVLKNILYLLFKTTILSPK